MDELKKGMKVKLKSGGPIMTVFKIESSLNESVFCQWFSGDKLERESFPPESLKIIKEEQEK